MFISQKNILFKFLDLKYFLVEYCKAEVGCVWNVFQVNIKVRSESCNIRVGGEAEEHCDEVRGREHGACTE